MRVQLALVLALVAVPRMAASFDLTPGFQAGAPVEMSRLAGFEGEWEIELGLPAADGEGRLVWRPWSTSHSTMTAMLGGAVLEEQCHGFPFEDGATGTDGLARWEYATMWTYDRFRRTYRVVVVDSVQGLAEILEGGFSESELVLTNLETGTANPLGSDGGRQKTRIVLSELGPDRFVLTCGTPTRASSSRPELPTGFRGRQRCAWSTGARAPPGTRHRRPPHAAPPPARRSFASDLRHPTDRAASRPVKARLELLTSASMIGLSRRRGS